MSKSLEDFRKDKIGVDKQIEQVRQQLIMLTGVAAYIAQEIAKLEKPEEVTDEPQPTS